MERSADTEFHGLFREPTYFEDLTERCAVKLTSLLRITGPAHYGLWQEKIGGVHFKERTGQFTPIYFMELEVTDEPVETRESFEVEVQIRLGKQLGLDGQIERLISEGETQVYAHRLRGGERVCVGRTRKHSVFTRPDADPKRRKVTELHPSLKMGGAPRREIHVVTAAELLVPPEGYRPHEDGSFADPDSHVWSYQQTDPNRHVHAMDYVRALEFFAVDHLAHLGRSPRHYFFDRARILFRKPCFTGDFYRRQGTFYLSPDGAHDVFIGTVVKVTPEGAPPAAEQPAVVVQLFAQDRE